MMKFVAVVGITLALLPGAAAAETPTGAPTDENVTTHIAAINGSGCPAGSVTVVPYPNNTGIVVSYSSFYVQRGGDSETFQGYQNCNLDIKIHVPSGFTFAISKAMYNGYAYVVGGAKAKLVSKYNFQGQAPTISTHVINSSTPYDDNWTIADEFSFSNLVWAPCGQDVILSNAFELRAQPYGPSKSPTDVSFVTANKSDHGVTTDFNFAWNRC
jgi:hypothetical protein